ncbi:RloB family protein [Desulfosarcina sp. OttesenSCG-928-A07]|nr:RloB family protein [Desulfosarcina sp. OttesenSCG-928-G17]MDL2329571.1 RloB family protein [Desulfosarcina sp. OttesenSCG-928-A07]
MGKSRQDQLHHKQKTRSVDSLRRRQAQRAPYDRVLIVCEGEKTEPIYLRALIDHLKLSTANIKIVDKKAGSVPKRVVELAEKYAKDKKDYNQIYCVFDKDQHSSYDEARQRIQTKRNQGFPITAITSVPCFEFWLLLHFKYTTESFEPKKGSICADVIEALRKFLPNYQKGGRNIYKEIKTHLPTAIENAKKVSHDREAAGTDMPSTEMHKLVEYLQKLKNPEGPA